MTEREKRFVERSGLVFNPNNNKEYEVRLGFAKEDSWVGKNWGKKPSKRGDYLKEKKQLFKLFDDINNKYYFEIVDKNLFVVLEDFILGLGFRHVEINLFDYIEYGALGDWGIWAFVNRENLMKDWEDYKIKCKKQCIVMPEFGIVRKDIKISKAFLKSQKKKILKCNE